MTFHPIPKKKHIIASAILSAVVLALHQDLEPDPITMAQELMHQQIANYQAKRTFLLLGIRRLKSMPPISPNPST